MYACLFVYVYEHIYIYNLITLLHSSVVFLGCWVVAHTTAASSKVGCGELDQRAIRAYWSLT